MSQYKWQPGVSDVWRFRAWDREKTAAEQSWQHKLNADACHCSRFWLRAESLRYQSAHACTFFPLVEADIKMLTRSMRFPHEPPAGNSRRGEVDDGEAENDARKRGTGSVFKAHISFHSDVAREERAMKRLRHERNSICCDSRPPCRWECGRTAPLDLCCVWWVEEKEGNTFDLQPSVNKLIFLELSLWMAVVWNRCEICCSPQCSTLLYLDIEGKDVFSFSLLVSVQTLTSCWTFVFMQNKWIIWDPLFDQMVFMIIIIGSCFDALVQSEANQLPSGW